ncbi:HRDC domain-containing protein [Corynebacterium halotolerans]|uniref:Ribonuclease D protein n=1 Tax=Corynebacterium halotolerans YIM 70093 = DSM 44683 TaxID=1121362 RepID=M1P7L1_9CORY|nr:ribonuclease D [Corynebacterium halotolerans]AGF72641.1 ribonuclease D protein [Corynebacterium halotolerans YIM 70093 = DSM 44683]
MATLLSTPRDGVPPLLHIPEQFREAAAALASGQGPVAVDTERASGFRYDDRAFLVQLRRRGVGTLLIDPEGYREEFTAAFAPVLGGHDWVIHAAASDLPSLAWLGLHPGRIFDTELAGRLAGFDHVNLAAMIGTVFDLRLEKGHGAEDWSKRPLPADWLIYAALDVELLLELAEAMAELLDAQGKLEWAEEEFEYIRAIHADITGPPEPSWRSTKGVATLHRPEQLVVARELWMIREAIAVDEDRAVSRILPNKVLVEIARRPPGSARELGRVRGFPARRKSAATFWYEAVERALESDPATWPTRPRMERVLPSRQTWANSYPASYDLLQRVRESIEELAAEIEVPTENILRPATLRTAVWAATDGGQIRTSDELTDLLRDHGARDWQIELTYPLFTDVLFR